MSQTRDVVKNQVVTDTIQRDYANQKLTRRPSQEDGKIADAQQHHVFQLPGVSAITHNLLPPLVSDRDLLALSLTSKSMQGLFAKPLAERRLLAFQQFVARRQLDQAKKILAIYPEYLILRGRFSDYSGRIFEAASAFEYLHWANDYDAINNLRSAIPTKIYQEKLAREMYEQFLHVESDGITFTYAGVKVKENHFDNSLHYSKFNTLKQNYENWSKEEKKQFCIEIANIQATVPVYIAQAICATEENPNSLHVNLTDVRLEEICWYPLSDYGLGHRVLVVRAENRAVATNHPYSTMVDNTIKNACKFERSSATQSQ